MTPEERARARRVVEHVDAERRDRDVWQADRVLRLWPHGFLTRLGVPVDRDGDPRPRIRHTIRCRRCSRPVLHVVDTDAGPVALYVTATSVGAQIEAAEAAGDDLATVENVKRGRTVGGGRATDGTGVMRRLEQPYTPGPDLWCPKDRWSAPFDPAVLARHTGP